MTNTLLHQVKSVHQTGGTPLNSKIIRGLYLGEDGMPTWGVDRPSDTIAESSLKFDLNFGAEAARRFLTVYDSTVPHIVTEVAATKEAEKSAEEILTPANLEVAAKPSGMRFAGGGEGQQITPTTAPPVRKDALEEHGLNDIMFQSNPGGTVTISATLDAAGLDKLEKKIAAFKMLLS